MVEANLAAVVDDDDPLRRASLVSRSRGEEQERSRDDLIIASEHSLSR